MRSLAATDHKLGVKWNGSHFVVTYRRPYGEPANIHLVRADDGGFRQPDGRDLEFIRRGNLDNEGVASRLARLAYHSESIREKMRRDSRDNIRHMTADNKRQLARAFTQLTNQGKGNSAFRRVPLKRKGKTWGEIEGEKTGNPDHRVGGEVPANLATN